MDHFTLMRSLSIAFSMYSECYDTGTEHLDIKARLSKYEVTDNLSLNYSCLEKLVKLVSYNSRSESAISDRNATALSCGPIANRAGCPTAFVYL